MEHTERQLKSDTMDFLCIAGDTLLADKDRALAVLANEDNVTSLMIIIQDYRDYQKRISVKESIEEEHQTRKKKRSIIDVISSFFKSLFGKSKKEDDTETGHYHGPSVMKKKTGFSRQTRDLYSKIKNNKSKIIPLSDHLELTPENELRVDTIINEIRGNNLKIVIPIYKAHTSLYPNRSQKFLTPNVEYLLVDPDIIQTAESVRSFTDGLVGTKLKDEIIPGNGIMAIEKYLLTLYRQKRALNLKKARGH